jgi:hypothetical protein
MIVEVTDERKCEMIEKVAIFFAERRMGAPAIMFFESIRPLSFIGSQVMYFLVPFANAIFTGNEFEEFAAIMQDQENVRLLVNRIDELDEQYNQKIREEERIKRKKWWNKIKNFFRWKK